MKITFILFALVGLLATTACNDTETSSDPNVLFAGNGSKTWVVDNDGVAEGAQRNNESYTMLSDGNLRATIEGQTYTGTWNYNPGANTLSMTLGGTTETFKVEDSEDDELELISSSGEKMELELAD